MMELFNTKAKKYPQNTLLVEVNKPLFYHAEHEVGELIDIYMKDVNELIANGVVSVIVNKNGFNTRNKEFPYNDEKVTELDF